MIKNLRKNSLRVTALLSLTVMLQAIPGCKKTEQQPVQPSSVPAVVPAKPEVPALQQQNSSVVSLSPPTATQFDFSSKKDPFKPYIIIKSPTASASQGARSASHLPIHSFDVNQFKLIGIITGGKENKAMVTDPSGKGYVLRVGMTIGKNGGRVTAITSTGVEIREQFRDDNGRVRKENIKLTLPRKY